MVTSSGTCGVGACLKAGYLVRAQFADNYERTNREIEGLPDLILLHNVAIQSVR